MKKTIKQYGKKNITIDDMSSSKVKIDIKRVQTGIVQARKCDMEKSDDTRFEDNPVYFYVLNHPKHGHFIIDAGLDSSFIHDEHGSHKGILRKKVGCKCTLAPNHNLVYYLKSNNISVKKAFLSHLHFDHIAGLIDVCDIKTCVCGHAEKYNPFKPLYYGNHLRNIETMEILDFENTGKFENTFSAIDYFGDLSLIIVLTEGHTKGHISFFVNTQNGLVLIACDAYVYDRESLRKNGCGKFSHNYMKATHTLNNIVKLLKEHDEIMLYTGH